MRRALITLFALVAMAASLTGCGGSHKVVYRDRTGTSIVLRDAPTTTTTAASSQSYYDYPPETSFYSPYYGFDARFPDSDYPHDMTPTKLDMPADSEVTAFTSYFTRLYAAKKNGRFIYCGMPSQACTLSIGFTVDVYPDNSLNWAALQPSEYEECQHMTFTGRAGVVCSWPRMNDDGMVNIDGLVRSNGHIFNLSVFGQDVAPDAYTEFIQSFGFRGTA